MFNRLKITKQRNHIYTLKNESGIWVDNSQEIETIIMRHFQDIYIPTSTLANYENQHEEDIDFTMRELHLPTISDETASSLLAPFSYQEVKHVMFNIDENKSPSLELLFRFHQALLG